jgi:hypothetical protein
MMRRVPSTPPNKESIYLCLCDWVVGEKKRCCDLILLVCLLHIIMFLLCLRIILMMLLLWALQDTPTG